MGRERCETVEDPWNTTEKRSFHIDYLEGRAVAGPGRGLSLGRSRSSSSNHHVSVLMYTNDVSYTSGARAKMRSRDGVALSLSSRETRRREPPQRQGRATPLDTSTPSPRARRLDRPAPRYTRSSSGEPAAHVIPQRANNTHNKQPPKNQLDAKESRKD